MKPLFVCIHNSARSQMAEAFVAHESEGHIQAESAGLEPGSLNPLVVEAMREIGIDISQCKCKSVTELLTEGRTYSHVITVCDEASAERCPVIPGTTHRIHWSFPDPSTLQGTNDVKLEEIRVIRDSIRHKVHEFLMSSELI